MRIAHVVALISDTGAFGGPLRVALNQVRELRLRGHDALIVGGWAEQKESPSEIDGVPVRTFSVRQVPGAGFAGLFSTDLLRWLRSEQHLDVVHVHAGRDLLGQSVMALLRQKRIPYVLQTHGMVQPDRRVRAFVLDRLIGRANIRAARAHLVLTAEERAAIVRVVGASHSTLELGNGVPVSTTSRSTDRRQGAEVLFLARLHERKRPLAFVQAAACVRTSEAVRYRLVGPDEGQAAAVLEEIDRLHLGALVAYEGPIPYSQTLDRMQQASIYVLPSVDEPFPMTLLEALSLGLPTICTDTCGIAADLSARGAAWVTDGSVAALADAISTLLRDKQMRADYSEQARRAIEEQYGVGPVVDRLLNIYRDVIPMRT